MGKMNKEIEKKGSKKLKNKKMKDPHSDPLCRHTLYVSNTFNLFSFCDELQR